MATSLDERYGRRPARASRRPLAAALVAFVVVALAWAVWAGVGVSRSTLDWAAVAVDTSDPALARVSFEVSPVHGGGVVCAVQATDAAGQVVGWVDVPVAATASGTARAVAQVRTSEAAAGGGVASCARR